MTRIQKLAEETFGDKEKANRWLRRTLAELGGETPLVIAQTEAGARIIETMARSPSVQPPDAAWRL